MHRLSVSLVTILVFVFMVGCGEMPTEPINDAIRNSREQLAAPALDADQVATLIGKETAQVSNVAGKTNAQYVVIAHHATYREVAGDVAILEAYYFYQVRIPNSAEALINGAAEITCTEYGNELENCSTSAIAFSYEQGSRMESLRTMFRGGIVDLNTDVYATFVARIHGDGAYGDITLKRQNVRDGDIVIVPSSEFTYYFDAYVARSTPHVFSLEKGSLRGIFELGEVAENMLLVTWSDLKRVLGDKSGDGVIVSIHVMGAGGTTLGYESDVMIQESKDHEFGEDFVKVQVVSRPELVHLNITTTTSAFAGDHYAFTFSVKEIGSRVYGLLDVVNQKG